MRDEVQLHMGVAAKGVEATRICLSGQVRALGRGSALYVSLRGIELFPQHSHLNLLSRTLPTKRWMGCCVYQRGEIRYVIIAINIQKKWAGHMICFCITPKEGPDRTLMYL